MITIDDVRAMPFPKIGEMPYVGDLQNSLAARFMATPIINGRNFFITQNEPNGCTRYTGFPVNRLTHSLRYDVELRHDIILLMLENAFRKLNQEIESKCLALLTPFYRENRKPNNMSISIQNLRVNSNETCNFRYETHFSLDVAIGAV